MLTRPTSVSRARFAGLFALAIGAIVLVPAPAAAQTAEVRYERALAREEAARASDAPRVATLRSIAVASATLQLTAP